MNTYNILIDNVQEKYIATEIMILIKQMEYVDFINLYNNNWEMISTFNDLEDDFFELYYNKINWEKVAIRPLTENFMRKFDKYIHFPMISKYQKLSEQFIYDYINKLDSFDISTYQKMSEGLMDTISLFLNWQKISERQKLSETFIRKYINYIDPCSILMCQELHNYSDELIEELRFRAPDNDSDLDIYIELN